MKKVWWRFLFPLLVLSAIGVSVLGCLGAPRYSGPKTDHFDGETFKNSGPYEDRGFLDVLKWKMGADESEEWPEWVEIPAQPPPPRSVDSGVRITMINHATVLIQLGGVNIVTDPIWSDRASPLSWLGPKRHKRAGVDFDALPKIDAVVISHNHYDHLDIPTLARIAKRDHPPIYAGLGTKALLEEHDVAGGVDLDWWQSVQVASATITFVPAQHWSTRGLGDRNVNLWGSWFVKQAGESVYFAGDTGNGPHFQAIRERLGAPSIALLPIGAYLPRWFMRPQHIDPAEAVAAHRTLGAKHSVAIHWGTFNQTDEGMNQPARELIQKMREANIPPSEIVLLENGAAFSSPGL
jgi:L-ascorbate metabolism protein UlaG (beta-lactamase superfamily)